MAATHDMARRNDPGPPAAFARAARLAAASLAAASLAAAPLTAAWPSPP